MKIKTFITTSSMLVMSVIGGYSQSVSAFTGPLYVDKNFGVNGTALSNLIPDQDGDVYHISTGVAANNKVVTLTGIELFNTNQKVYALTGFDDQGNPDSGFGVAGQVLLWDLIHHQAHEMVVQANGKIIVAGRANMHISGSEDAFVAKYLANGDLDTSFGNNGIITLTNRPDLASGFGVQVATNSVGGVILAGGTDRVSIFYLGSSGVSYVASWTDLGGKAVVMDMEVDDQGRIVIVGGYSPDSFLNEKIFVARFSGPLMMLDKNNFKPAGCSAQSSCGYTILDVYDTHPDLIIQQFVNSNYQMDVALKKPHGSGTYNKIVVSGSFGIVRLNEDGNEDTSFGVNGRVQNDLQFVDSDEPGYNYVEIRSDEKIASLNNQSSTLALYRSDGEIDLKCTGVESVAIPKNQTITPVFQLGYKNYSMKIDSKDRIVVGGAAIVSDDDFNMDIEAAFVERYRRFCHLDNDPPTPYDPYKKADPTTKMTIRDVHPVVHPQDIVGPEWKIRFYGQK